VAEESNWCEASIISFNNLPSIFRSFLEVVGNFASIFWHSSCNSFTAFLSMLGTGGRSPSDQVGSVLAAAITAPSTKASPSLDSRPARKFSSQYF
jgi:hypothetical protein